MFKMGFSSSLPIALGYIPVAIAFGVSAVAMGFSPIEVVLASVLIFAGSSQFALISLLPSSPFSAVVIPLSLNLRHLVYGCIVSQRFNIRFPYLTAFGLTDEVFASLLKAPDDERFIWGMVLGAYISWVAGSLIGALGGDALLHYQSLSSSLLFSLTSLFFILLILNLGEGRWLSALIGGTIALFFHFFGHAHLGILLAGVLAPIVALKVKGRREA